MIEGWEEARLRTARQEFQDAEGWADWGPPNRARKPPPSDPATSEATRLDTAATEAER